MEKQLTGIHHVTAIASDAQQNVNFYTQVLGLRLVKITINYDDPGSYHLYYGDEAGSPGSILTFFAWPGGRRGRQGTGQVAVTSYSVPPASLGYWQDRFERSNVRCDKPVTRWDEEVLAFYDPDGLPLELVTDGEAGAMADWKGGGVPLDYATRGFHSVTLALASPNRTAKLLTETLGFQLAREEGNRARYVAKEPETARIVDLLTSPGTPQAASGVGSVHHVAWRTPTDAQQEEWQSQLTQQRIAVSPVMDRQYFHSIYFREPGGVLFEIATDQPGFTTDETLDKLGTTLRLSEWLEPERERIQQALPELTLPQTLQEA